MAFQETAVAAICICRQNSFPANGRKHSTCCLKPINICQPNPSVTWSKVFSLRPPAFCTLLFPVPVICLLFFDQQGNASSILCSMANVSSAGPHLALPCPALTCVPPAQHMSTQLSSKEDSQLEQMTEYVRPGCILCVDCVGSVTTMHK